MANIFCYYYPLPGQWAGVRKKLKQSAVSGPLPLVGQCWATGLAAASDLIQHLLQLPVDGRSQLVVFRGITDAILVFPLAAGAAHFQVTVPLEFQKVTLQRRGR